MADGRDNLTRTTYGVACCGIVAVGGGVTWLVTDFEEDAIADHAFFYPCETVKLVAEMYGIEEEDHG